MVSLPLRRAITDGRQHMRAHLCDTAGILIAYAENLQNYVAVGDDAGMRRSVHMLGTHLNAIIKTANLINGASRRLFEVADEG